MAAGLTFTLAMLLCVNNIFMDLEAKANTQSDIMERRIRSVLESLLQSPRTSDNNADIDAVDVESEHAGIKLTDTFIAARRKRMDDWGWDFGDDAGNRMTITAKQTTVLPPTTVPLTTAPLTTAPPTFKWPTVNWPPVKLPTSWWGH